MVNMKPQTKNTLYWGLLILVGVFFYLMNLYTPFTHDDYAYAHYYSANSELIRPTSDPITWGTLLPSMWHHYCCVNGRFTSHILIQLFCGLINKSIFNICNTIVFLMMLHLLVRISCKSTSIAALCAVVLSTFLFFPYPGQTMLWITGAINYLWTTTFALGIIYYIQNHKDQHRNIIHHILAFLIGVFVGWMQESITIGLSGGLFIWFLFNRKQFNGINAALAVGLWLGTLLIIIGPGTFNRINTEDEFATNADLLQMVSSRIIGTTLMLIPYILPFAALAICIYTSRHKALKRNLSLPFWIMAITFLFDLAIGKQEIRVFYGFIVYCLLYILCFADKIIRHYRKYVCLAFITVSIVLSSFEATNAIKAATTYSEYTKALTNKIKHADSNAIIDHNPFLSRNKWVMVPYPSPDIHNFHNRVMAFYYNKESIQFVPSEIFRLHQSSKLANAGDSTDLTAMYGNKRYPVYEIPQTNFWMIKIPTDKLVRAKTNAVYAHDPAEQLSTIDRKHRLLRYLLNSLPSDRTTQHTFYLTEGDESYLFLPKSDYVIDIVIN